MPSKGLAEAADFPSAGISALLLLMYMKFAGTSCLGDLSSLIKLR